ncbi:GntR family transcriptional regulator [Rhodococcus sp. W8901]|uniref:GntR family transcriptional regulator n=1 Tax=Rhodococcus sp. W8901 TaxID=2742603 RepID=UPI0015838755|nr:GntR family transcriptional regulator [Rhodococcus sp. W8901]QKT13480.1 GntR family transcriptional regulator [Rhodococcus sp. W8901]
MTDPQHVLLAQELIARIQSGEFSVGDKLPTEHELCESRSLARGTVRQALKHLEDAGMISRRRGAGTTVSSPVTMGGHQAFVTSRAGMLSFVRHTRIRHPVTNSVVVDRELAALTGLPTGTEWFCVKGPRVIRESDLPPICWSELYLRADLPYRDMLLTAKFDIANLVRQRIEQEVSATRLAGAVSEALDVESGSAALVVVHRYFDSSDVLEAVGVHIHPADRYRVATSVGSQLTAD